MGRRLATPVVLLLAVPLSAHTTPAELKPHTLEAFLRYAAATESRFLAEASSSDSFVYVDALPAGERQGALDFLRRGEVFMSRLRTRGADGKEIKAKDGIIHHWLGAVFIPGVGLEQTLALVQDYDRHAEIYTPEVDQAHIIDREDDHFTVFYRFRKKKVITVILDTDHDVRYFRAAPGRAYSISRTTRIQEVQNAGKPNQQLKPVGNDGGFLWRLNTYWKFLERDGGTYVESESISLTRGIPLLLKWMIAPFITGVPKELLSFTLEKTREELVDSAGQQSDAAADLGRWR